MAVLGAHKPGMRLGYNAIGQDANAADLVLTASQSGTQIALKSAGIRGAGFIFGGTVLGTGEVGFVTSMNFSSGAPEPLLQFSAYGTNLT
jgi:hypothetical protein